MAFHPHPLVYLVIGLVLGTLAPLPGPSGFASVALGLSCVVAALAIVAPGRWSLIGLMVAAGAAGSALALDARSSYGKRALPADLDEIAGPVVIVGRAATDARIVEDEMRFDLEVEQVVAHGRDRTWRGRTRVFVRGQPGEGFAAEKRPRRGDGIRAWAELRRPSPVRSPGGFDQQAWAMREGLHGFASCKSERLLEVTPAGDGGRGPLDRARDRLKRSWRHVPDPTDRAVTASMVLGDEDALDPETREAFRAAGLLHLLVVSGAQVAALLIGLRRGLPRGLRWSWPGCALESGALVLYCLLAGAEDSIVRATVMAVAFSAALRMDLKGGGVNVLAASALALLTLRPLDACDPGAQLSFTATLALILFALPLARRLEGAGVPGLLAEIAAATAAATIAVAPLTLAHFHRFSLISLPANLLAAPLAVLLLYGSLLTALFDAVLAPAAAPMGWICGLVAEGLRLLARHAAALDADWRGPALPIGLMIGGAGLALARGWRRAVLAFAGLLTALTMSGRPGGDGRLHLWFLDVGQGDALLVESPDGRLAAIDAGPAFDRFDSGERVVAPSAWALGYLDLEFLVVTHRHADHQGGAPFLERHFRPGRTYVNGESEAMKDFGPSIARLGDSWEQGGASYRVLGPDPSWPTAAADENSRSLVLEIRYGATSFLLLGDASALAERRLEIPASGYSVVKVAHHGAATSSAPGLVAAARPRLAVISVGERNRFSHPSDAVIERWRRAGALVLRTDRDRTIHVTSDGETIRW